MMKIASIFLLSICSALAAPSLRDLIPIGSNDGYNQNGNCRVSHTHMLPYSRLISLTDDKCIAHQDCLSFFGKDDTIGGGGCSQYISQNNYEVHYSNGKNPHGAPYFCSSNHTPGGVRVLIYGKRKKVEFLEGDGSLKGYCYI